MSDRGFLHLETHPVFIRSGLCVGLAWLLLVTVLSSTTQASAVLPGLFAVPPNVTACTYLPDPGSDIAYACPPLETAPKPAFVNVTFRIRLTLDDPEGDLANVTIYFDFLDYLNAAGGQPGSLVKTVEITQNGTQPAEVETNWTYAQLGDIIRPPDGSHYLISIVATDVNGTQSDPYYFDLNVNVNSPPFVSTPPPNPYLVTPFITFPDPVVPTAQLDIEVQDLDDDSLVVTWDWGDGTSTANITGPSGKGVRVLTTHDYPPELLRLNETPRTASFDLWIYVHDRIEGHNTTAGPYEVQFYLSRDDPPNPSAFLRPATVGSLWKVGDPIPMEGYALDRQGDPIEGYYWDFDNRSEPGGSGVNGDGIYDNDMEAVGNATTHAYTVPSYPGTYTITLWASDGLNKKVCRYDNATTCVEPKSHWTRSQWTVRVRANGAPLIALTNQNGSIERGTILNATILDPDGDPMTVTWSFGDGTSGTTDVPGLRPSGEPIEEPYPAIVSSIPHDYPRPGEFYVLTARVTDGNVTDEATARVFVSSENLPPDPPLLQLRRANDTLAANGTYSPNEVVRLEMVLSDAENDTLEIHISWGDATETVLTVSLPGGNVTGAPGASCGLNDFNQTVCFVDHTYAQVGNYTIKVNVTDNRRYVVLNATTFEPQDLISHSVEGSVGLFVELPARVEPEAPWDWWDYSTFAAVVGIPFLLITRGLVRSYRERKEE